MYSNPFSKHIELLSVPRIGSGIYAAPDAAALDLQSIPSLCLSGLRSSISSLKWPALTTSPKQHFRLLQWFPFHLIQSTDHCPKVSNHFCSLFSASLLWVPWEQHIIPASLNLARLGAPETTSGLHWKLNGSLWREGSMSHILFRKCWKVGPVPSISPDFFDKFSLIVKFKIILWAFLWVLIEHTSPFCFHVRTN